MYQSGLPKSNIQVFKEIIRNGIEQEITEAG